MLDGSNNAVACSTGIMTVVLVSDVGERERGLSRASKQPLQALHNAVPGAMEIRPGPAGSDAPQGAGGRL